MGRRDYYDDPAAPAANAIVAAASIVLTNDSDCVLLHRRTDNGLWALPGGTMEVGESLADCALRELREETAVEAIIDGLVGVYSDPLHVFAYDDGEVRQEFSICFHGTPTTHDEPTPSHESSEVRWVPLAKLAEFDMHPAIRTRITDYIRGDTPAIR